MALSVCCIIFSLKCVQTIWRCLPCTQQMENDRFMRCSQFEQLFLIRRRGIIWLLCALPIFPWIVWNQGPLGKEGGALHLLAIQCDEMQTIYGIKGNLKNTDDNHCLMLRCNFSVNRSKSAPSAYVYCSPNDSVHALQLANKVQNKATSQEERESETTNKNQDFCQDVKFRLFEEESIDSGYFHQGEIHHK